MDAAPQHDSAWLTQVRRKLRAWYRRNARDLPWRRTSDPYRIWLSEIMLQQTQVVTVIPYYEAFVEAFPTVEDLAAAEESTIMRMWEGLGYYRRARQMHAAAKQIVTEHQGKFPDTFKEVHALPGVGRYTAGAILSISQDQPLPILEGNTVRLHARLTGYRQDVKAKEGQNYLWDVAERLVPRRGTGELNQALMELGATICIPRNPKCLICPLQRECEAARHGWQTEIPFARAKLKYEDRIETAILVTVTDHILMRQYEPGERWAGLWDVPRLTTEASPVEEAVRESLSGQLKTELGMHLAIAEPKMKLKHAVTRFRIQLFACHAHILQPTTSKQQLPRPNKPWIWMKRSELNELPLHVTGRKISQALLRS